MKKYSKIILFIPFHSLLLNEALRSERGDGERAERQGGRDQRVIGEKRMRDFKVKMLQFRLDSKLVSAWIVRYGLNRTISAWIGMFRQFWQFRPIWSDLTRIGANWPNSAWISPSQWISAYLETKKKKFQCGTNTRATTSPTTPRVRHGCGTPVILSVLSRALRKKKKVLLGGTHYVIKVLLCECKIVFLLTG